MGGHHSDGALHATMVELEDGVAESLRFIIADDRPLPVVFQRALGRPVRSVCKVLVTENDGDSLGELDDACRLLRKARHHSARRPRPSAVPRVQQCRALQTPALCTPCSQVASPDLLPMATNAMEITW